MTASLFVTGASGFVGGRFLAQLSPDHYRSITLLCRGALTLPDNLACAPNVNVVRGALHETGTYAEYLQTDTRVVHLAAITGKAARADYIEVNVQGTAKLVEAAQQAPVAGFLFASSIAVSFRDRRGYHYADSKQQAESLLQASGLPYCILRPTIILGRDSPVWHSFLGLARKSLIVLPGNGHTRIQPIHVDDLVRLVMDMLDSERFNNEILEIGGPDVVTMDDFVQRIYRGCSGGQARIVHLPLALILVPLRLLERIIPSLLPVSSGQFASFNNDGTVTANALVRPVNGDMMNMDAMLASLASEDDCA